MAEFSSAFAQEVPCGDPVLQMPYEVSRIWPIDGGVLPADEPILIEMLAPPLAPETPEQDLEPVTFKEVYLGPLQLGLVYSLQTLRSDYGSTRYLGGPILHWEPTEWDTPLERRLLVIVRLMEFLEDGTVAPADFVEGESYTLSMKVADSQGEPGSFKDLSFSFLAGPPKGPLDLPMMEIGLAMELAESCEWVNMGCESDPETCEVNCTNTSQLARIGMDTTLSPLTLETERSHAFRVSLSTHAYAWISVLFPDEQPPEWIASFGTFHGDGSIPESACATISVGSPGLDPISVFETCSDVGSIPPCEETDPVIADEEPGEETDIGEFTDTTDTSSLSDTNASDPDDATVPFLSDTNLSPPPTPDGDATLPNEPLPDIPNPDEAYNTPAYDGCACDAAYPPRKRMLDSMVFLLGFVIGIWRMRAHFISHRHLR